MKLSKNSWHARLNAYIYGYWYLDDVDCLCPYFWGTLLAIILLPLWLIGRGISYIVDRVPENNIHLPKPNWSNKTKNKVTKILGYGFLLFMISIVGTAIWLAILEYGIVHVLFWIGAVAGIVGGIVGFIFLLSLIRDRYDSWRYDHPKKKRPNLLMEFIRAKKNKHCPLVQWDE